MRAVAALVLVLAVGAMAAVSLPEEDMQAVFTGYMTRFNKVYAKEEFFGRYNVFKANYAKILAHNAKGTSDVKLGTTSLTDLSTSEYKKRLGFKLPADMQGKQLKPMAEGEVDDTVVVDWRTKTPAVVAPIKDQGDCGSCWAFSAVASTESAIAIAGNTLQTLSEQQLVDCTTDDPYYCEGCDGCLMHTAFQYIMDKKGLCTEKEYPYTGEDGTCNTKKCTSAEIPIKSYVNVTCADENFCDTPLIKANETKMMDFVNKGVLSVAIEADQDVFQNYVDGIIDSTECGTDLDHGVNIVGYGKSTAGKAYWIVRNSWGSSWGLDGYVYIAQGKNTCGISLYSNQPYTTA